MAPAAAMKGRLLKLSSAKEAALLAPAPPRSLPQGPLPGPPNLRMLRESGALSFDSSMKNSSFVSGAATMVRTASTAMELFIFKMLRAHPEPSCW